MSNTKYNALALYANFVVLGLIGLLINPLMVRALGLEQFGVWKACLRLLDLTAVADGRASQALKWIVAHRNREEDIGQKQRDVGAALTIWLLWTPLLFIAVLSIVYFLPNLVTGISASNLPHARCLAALLGFNIVLSGLLGIADATLVGTNQGFRSYLLATTFLVLCNFGTLIVAQGDFGLIGIGLVTVVSSFLNGIATWQMARRYVRWWGVRSPSLQDVKRVLSFSNWTLIGALFQAFMLSTEVLVIGYFNGPENVSRYTLTCYVSTFVLSICLMTGSAVTPKLGSMIGSGDVANAVALHDRTREMLLALITIGAVGLILCNRPFVQSWAGRDYYLGDLVNLGVVAVFVQLALVRFDFQIQDISLQIAQKVAWMAMGSGLAIVFGATLYRLTGHLTMLFVGIVIGRLPMSFALPRLVAKVIPGHSRHLGSMIALLSTLAVAYGLSQLWHVEGWWGFVSAAIVAIILGGSSSFAFILSADTRHNLRSKLPLPLHRKAIR